MYETISSALALRTENPDSPGCSPCRTTGPTPQGYCQAPPTPAMLMRGMLPVAFAECAARDKILQYGRLNQIWVPAYHWWNLLQDAADYSPRTPLSVDGTKEAGTLSLDFELADPSPATAQGNDYRFLGFAIEINSSQNVNPGVTEIDISGTFQDGQPWLQTVQFQPGGPLGVARYYVTATRETQGGAYPSLFVVSNGLQLTGPAVAIPLTAAAAPNDATSIVPTNGIRAVERTLSVDVTRGPAGTGYRVELLSPPGQLWNEYSNFNAERMAEWRAA